MQRLLLICRHAETQDPYPLQPDFERELTQNGLLQAKRTGQWLREHFKTTDAILASPARRANVTAQQIAGRLYYDQEKIAFLPDLYNARETQLIQILSELPGEIKTVVLVGHNPGVTRLVRDLTSKLIGYLDPAEAVAVSIDLEKWEDVHYTTGQLIKQNY
ncbi:SixA phosphatase family protein [Pontibacter silvestris]|uniref:SixA phosphatase family protein n=1 Tax=Pontibacter silvestris TaxID=2305183 RepID=A0ABW4WYL0_9BACT|nr:histidine phosphatase family protein [Pontibacter silvestris]MCC9135196.1 histidine phosphatase family protein [Pontibacter silvestris]